MRYIAAFFSVLFLLLFTTTQAFAVENPLAVPNNKAGIHILFPEELGKAATLVNSNGGDWGYVVIPIQSGDKDLQKWQDFMDNAKKLHIIPIIRLATEGDYFNTKVWRVPTESDVLDFANFLNSLTWPTKNRYIIVYNEVNRGDEWGGIPNPAAYAQLLSYAYDTFKSRSQDFFIISAGLDNGAATTATSLSDFDFLSGMNLSTPGIFDKIDGIGSHSYPNPAFSTPPTFIAWNSVASFQFERNFIEGHSSKDLPVFITETGWSQDTVGQDKAAGYLATAMQTVWADKNIVTVAPFLLQAGAGPFATFSLTNPDGSPNGVYTAYADVAKIKGAPVVLPPKSVLAANIVINMPTQSFQKSQNNSFPVQFATGLKTVLKWFLNLH